MQIVKCDTKGRLYLRESLRQQYGQQFVVLTAPGEVVLLPVPEDPIADLRYVTRRARGKSLKQLRALIQTEAARQVM